MCKNCSDISWHRLILNQSKTNCPKNLNSDGLIVREIWVPGPNVFFVVCCNFLLILQRGDVIRGICVETTKRNADELRKSTHQSVWFADLRIRVSNFRNCYANEADHVTTSYLKSKTKIATVIMKWLSQGIPFICWNVGAYNISEYRVLHMNNQSLHMWWRYLLSVHDFSPSCLDMIHFSPCSPPPDFRQVTIWPSLRSAKKGKKAARGVRLKSELVIAVHSRCQCVVGCLAHVRAYSVKQQRSYHCDVTIAAHSNATPRTMGCIIINKGIPYKENKGIWIPYKKNSMRVDTQTT